MEAIYQNVPSNLALGYDCCKDAQFSFSSCWICGQSWLWQTSARAKPLAGAFAGPDRVAGATRGTLNKSAEVACSPALAAVARPVLPEGTS